MQKSYCHVHYTEAAIKKRWLMFNDMEYGAFLSTHYLWVGLSCIHIVLSYHTLDEKQHLLILVVNEVINYSHLTMILSILLANPLLKTLLDNGI